MELYKEILAKALGDEIYLALQNTELNLEKSLEMECYQALKKIKAIIEDDSLEDKSCFLKIEEIVRVFEQLGSSGGNRHDFG